MLSTKQKSLLKKLKKSYGYDLALNKDLIVGTSDEDILEILLTLELSNGLSEQLNSFMEEMDVDVSDDKASMIILTVINAFIIEILQKHKEDKTTHDYEIFLLKVNKILNALK